VRGRLERLTPDRREDLLSILRRGSDEAATCFCTAYHTRAWEEPGQGLACRTRLLDEGRSDGYLFYVDGRPVAWCQCGPWGSFAVIAPRPPAVPDAWAVTCMVVVPDARGQGVAHALLGEVLADLRRRGARHVYAFAHRLGPTYSSPLPELPESVCLKAGMTLARDDPECPLYESALAPETPR
jgi:GNAT superfamily N-acetyltransferase